MPKDILLRIGCGPYGVVAVGGARRAHGSFAPAYAHTRADGSPCATEIDRDGIVRVAAANKLRVEYVDLDGDGVRETPGLLLEGSRTNSVLRSQELDNAAWTTFRASITANLAVAPDGLLGGAATAEKIVEDATASATHLVRQAVTITAGEVIASTCFFKADTRTKVRLQISNGAEATGHRADFDLSAGTVIASAAFGTGTLTGSFIQKLSNGWYRCGVSGTVDGATTSIVHSIFLLDASGNASYTGDGTSGMLAWGAQLERSPFASSYIKTVASAVTRAADSLTVPFNFGPMDTTMLARMARPTWADASGSIGSVDLRPGQLSTLQPALIIGALSANRTWRASISLVSGSVSADAAIPAGQTQTISAQYKNFATGGQVAIDVGSGLSAFSSAASVGVTAFGNQNARPGGDTTAELYGVLLDLVIARGLFSLSEMSAVL